MLSLSKDAEFKRPMMCAVVGILFALIGIISLVCCWIDINYVNSLGNLNGWEIIAQYESDYSIMAYFPSMIMIFSAISLIIFAYGLFAPKNKVAYLSSIFGLAIIILAIFEHSWIYLDISYGSLEFVNVGIGFYLAMIAGLGMFFCGLFHDADYKRNSIKTSNLIGIAAAVIGITTIFMTTLSMNHGFSEDGLQLLHNATIFDGNIQEYLPLLVSLFSVLCVIPLVTDIFISNRTGLTLSAVCGMLIVAFTLLEFNAVRNQSSFYDLGIGFCISLICGIVMFLFPIFSRRRDKLSEEKPSPKYEKAYMVKFVGALASLVGVASIAFGWINSTFYMYGDKYNWTGLDLWNAHFNGFQAYLPFVILIISLVALYLFVRQMRQGKSGLGYTSIILGAAIIVFAVIFGIWASDIGTIYLNGNFATTSMGSGVYMSVITGVLIAVSGYIATRLKTPETAQA